MPATNKDKLPPTRRACSKCGRLGHLTRTCERNPKAHLKIGIEVEGFWRVDDFRTVKDAAAQWHMGSCGDGSLNGDDIEADVTSHEFQTRPGSLGEAISQLLAVYPHFTNASAGMHVHVSFQPGDVTALTCNEFFEFFAARWEAWGRTNGVQGEFWKRLRGENQYCRKPSYDLMWGRNRSGNVADMGRYNQLNFSAWSEHRTVECRLLPMFRDARLGVLAVEELIAIYEDWLSGGLYDAILESHNRTITVPAVSFDPVIIEQTHDFSAIEPFIASAHVEYDLPEYPAVAEGSVRLPRTEVANYLTLAGVL